MTVVDQAFEEFRAAVSTALTRYEVITGGVVAHESYCLCPECVCVRGVRAELESYAKRAAKKKRGKAK